MPETKTKTKKPAKTKTAEAPSQVVHAFKGFDPDLKCRGFQYEIGKTYTHAGSVIRCGTDGGFHACENPLDVWSYYGPIGEDGKLNRFCEVTQSGQIATDKEDSKVASAIITIGVEIALPDYIRRAVAWMMSKTKAAKGVDAASGHSSQLAASGYYSQLAASGDSSQLAASGHYSKLAASGHSSKLAASGYYSQLAASGDSSQLAASGDSSQLAASGHSSKLAASGYYSRVSVTGNHSVAASIARLGQAMACAGSAIMLSEYASNGDLLAVFASKVGENGIKPDTWYRLEGGKPVEVS
jgi:hypothetical protein